MGVCTCAGFLQNVMENHLHSKVYYVILSESK